MGPQKRSPFCNNRFSPPMEVIGNAEPHQPDILTTTILQVEHWHLSQTPAETSDRTPEWPNWTTPKKVGVEERRMASSLIGSHPTQRHVTSDDRLVVNEPLGDTVSLDDVKNAEGLQFDETEVTGLVKKRNYKVHMSVVITSSMLRVMVIVFDTRDGLNLVVHPSFQSIWCDCICSIHKTSLKSASSNPFNVRCKIMLFVQLGDLQVRVCLISRTIYPSSY